MQQFLNRLVRAVTILEMLAQFGETSHDKQFLTFGCGIHFFMLEDPGVAVRNEDRVEPGG